MPRADRNRQPEIRSACFIYCYPVFMNQASDSLVHPAHMNQASDSPVHPANMNRASDLPVHFCVHIRFMEGKHLVIERLTP